MRPPVPGTSRDTPRGSPTRIRRDVPRTRGTAAARLLVVSGPIASGKSTVGLAVGAELERRGVPAAVVDLDLVYELLDPLRRPKTSVATWSEARRACGRIVGGLLAERTVVVVEGDFGSARKRAELEETLPDDLERVHVSLTVGASASGTSVPGTSRAAGSGIGGARRRDVPGTRGYGRAVRGRNVRAAP